MTYDRADSILPSLLASRAGGDGTLPKLRPDIGTRIDNSHAGRRHRSAEFVYYVRIKTTESHRECYCRF